MFSSNTKQFEIRHLLTGFVVVGGGLGMIISGWKVTGMLGVATLVGVCGLFFSYCAMFVSDLIDDRRMDERRLWSRFFNGIGLLIICVTVLAVIILGFIGVLQVGFWAVDQWGPAIPGRS